MLTFVAVSAFPSPAAHAQASGAPLSISGRIVRLTAAGERPLPREVVTLHRVSSASAGPSDSVRTDAAGRFAFRIDADSSAMYIASARYGGIAYFAPPARAGDAPADVEITVYDTTSRDVPVSVQGRHLVVSAPNADGLRSIIDVFEIENDTILTRVAGEANRPTFSVVLPGGARNARVTQGDVSAEAVRVEGSRADIFAPLAPGLRQLVLAYDVPPDAFPLALPLERAVGVLEVLFEEPDARAEGARLVSQGTVTVDGRDFLRLLSREVPANGVVTLSMPDRGIAAAWRPPPWLLAVGLALLTLGAMLVVSRRSPAPVAAGASGRETSGTRDVADAGAPRTTAPEAPVHTTVALARAAAAVDALLAREETTTEQREGLARYRESLKARLADALADGSGAV